MKNKQAAYEKGMSSFGVRSALILSVDQCNIKAINHVLNKLVQLSPLLKKSVIDACVDTILDDGIIMPAEAELLRAVSETLDCPMPPLLNN